MAMLDQGVANAHSGQFRVVRHGAQRREIGGEQRALEEDPVPQEARGDQPTNTASARIYSG